jgi:uncharacterized phage protein gp47/JayE
MPWTTPTLKDVRSMVRDYVRGNLPGADATIPNSVLRVVSDSQGALTHLVLQYVDWLALQLIPDTAETEWLDRHGDIWLVNSDGTIGRKVATLAVGVVTFSGLAGTVVPVAARLQATANIEFETLEEVTISSSGAVEAPIRAITPGAIGNLLAGTSLGQGIAGVDTANVTYDMTGGTDEENDDDLRARVLERIQMPPMGGDAEDYINWTLRVPGVTRAWSFPLEMGIGSVTVRFMMDELRANNDGFPSDVDCAAVMAYLDTVRPVAVKDFFVPAPIKQFITCTIKELEPDSSDVRADIEVSLRNMLLERGKPGQTIYAAWKSEAILAAPEVDHFILVNNEDDIMPSPGHMPVLGDLEYV